MLESLEKKYKEASKAYAEGSPIMSDKEFDDLEKKLKELNSPLVNYVSEDFLNSEEDSEELANYETFSINSVDNVEDAKKWFEQNPNAEYVAALKMDGICTRLAISPTELIARSRNRMGRTPIDYTKAVNKIMDKPETDFTYTVTGESFVSPHHLTQLREVYGEGKYVLPRSAAISLLRTPDIHDKHMHLLNLVAFATDNTMDTYAQELEWLKSQGFKIPKYHVFKIDWNLDFEVQIESIMNMIDTGEPSDGVVVQLNPRGIDVETEGKYLSSQIALKFGKWGGEVHEAIVKGVRFNRARGNKGCVIEIEPITLPSGAKQTTVNAYNPGILQTLNIKKGSLIRFRHVSNNMANLVY